MRIIMIFIGVMIVLAGIIPLLGYAGKLPKFIPYEGTGYTIIVAGIGIIALIYAFINITMMMFSKIITIILAAMTIMGGFLPMLDKFLPAWIPTTGPLYAGLIILVGLIGVVYGMMSIG